VLHEESPDPLSMNETYTRAGSDPLDTTPWSRPSKSST
jgi:hypothetical protein